MRRPCDLTRRSPCRQDRFRSGTALIVSIVALVLVTTICFSLVRITLSATEQAERQHWRRQSIWLADSALARATERVRNEPDFSGEVWDLTLPGGTGDVLGRVVVNVVPADNPQERTITAIAEFPVHPIDHVRTTRSLTLPSLSDPPLPPGAPAETEDR